MSEYFCNFGPQNKHLATDLFYYVLRSVKVSYNKERLYNAIARTFVSDAKTLRHNPKTIPTLPRKTLKKVYFKQWYNRDLQIFITSLEITFISKFPSAFEVPWSVLQALCLPSGTGTACPRGSIPGSYVLGLPTQCVFTVWWRFCTTKYQALCLFSSLSLLVFFWFILDYFFL